MPNSSQSRLILGFQYHVQAVLHDKEAKESCQPRSPRAIVRSGNLSAYRQSSFQVAFGLTNSISKRENKVGISYDLSILLQKRRSLFLAYLRYLYPT